MMKETLVKRYIVSFDIEWDIPKLHRVEYMDGRKSLPLTNNNLKSLLRYSKLYRGNNSFFCTITGKKVGSIDIVTIPKRKDRLFNKERNKNIAVRLISTLKEAEKRMIILVMKYTKGNVTDASRILGISIPTLNTRMKNHKLTRKVIYNIVNEIKLQ